MKLVWSTDNPGSYFEELMTQEPMPPVGLIPKQVHDLQRLRAINAAIERYVAYLMPIPDEWADERDALMKRWRRYL